MPDRSRPPAANEPQSFPLPKASQYLLSNGLPVHTLLVGDLPTVKIELIFRAGSWFEELAGTSFFTMKMLAEGAGEKTSSELAAFFDERGAFIELNSGPDYSTFELLAVERHIPDLLPVVFEMITNPCFPDEELDLLKSIQRQQLSVNLEKNSYMASMLFRGRIFGEDHPYGRSMRVDTIERQQRDVVTDFYLKNIRNSFEIVVSGNVSETTMKMIDKVFSGMKINRPISFKGGVNDYVKSRENISRNKELQSSIRIGKPIISRDHEDYTNVFVANEILGGYFGSRLMQNIREEKGYTYGIYSSIVNQRKSTYLVIGTDVKKEYTEETIKEIRKEIIRLQKEEVSKDELFTVVNYIKGSYLASITTPFSIAEKFKTMHFYGLDFNYYDQLFDRLDAVAPDGILAVAQQYFTPDTMTEVVVG